MSDTYDVKMPDGTVVKNVPFGITKNQLMMKLGIRDKDVSALATYGREATKSLTDNLLGIPDLMLNAGAGAINDTLRPVRKLGEFAGAVATGNYDQFSEDPKLSKDPRRNNLNTINTPPLGQNFLMPTSDQVFGAVQSGTEAAARIMNSQNPNIPSASITPLNEAIQQQTAISQEGQEQNPNAAMAGNLTGDAAMLLGVRNPFAADRAINQVAHRRNLEAAQLLAKRGAQDIARDPTLKRAVSNVFSNGTGVQKLLNTTGRAAEAGLEGAVVALLNEGDPMEVAAYSAGGQLVGSAFLGGVSKLLSGGPTAIGLKVGTTAFAMGSLFQLVKESAPGGQDSLISSIESGFPKVMLGIALGGVSALSGAGRVSGGFPVTAIPKIADAITSIPRAVVISSLNEMLKDQSAEVVINKMVSDPEYFTAAESRRIYRAMTTESLSISDTIKSLSENNKFNEKLEALF